MTQHGSNGIIIGSQPLDIISNICEGRIMKSHVPLFWIHLLLWPSTNGKKYDPHSVNIIETMLLYYYYNIEQFEPFMSILVNDMGGFLCIEFESDSKNIYISLFKIMILVIYDDSSFYVAWRVVMCGSKNIH